MKFEYRIESINAGQQAPDRVEKVLNSLGEEGWEVVTNFQKQDFTVCFVLKKPKS